MRKISTLLFGFCFVASVRADVVEKIEFEGLDRVEIEAISDCITVKPNKKYDQADVDASLKALFGKDFFSYIKFIKRGNTLVIKCTEKPMVDRVIFEGNETASDDELKSVINGRIGEGRMLSIHAVKDVLSDFQMNYKSLGFCSAVIVPKIIKRVGNKVDLVFEISEGSKTIVKKIFFIGNKSFTDEELKDLLSTKEEKIWRVWDYESHVFREDKVDVDIENLTLFYKSNGFPFFTVTSTSAEMDFDKKSYYYTFSMDEGDRYTIKSVSLESKTPKIKAEDYRGYIRVISGSAYNENLINADSNELRKRMALKDNPFTDVTVETNYDRANKTADIKYLIVEKPKTFIERIDIIGNNRTLDKVIRREFSVHEGDAYNAYKMQRAAEHLKGIEYFEDVRIADAPGSAADRKVITVAVKEKESTAQFRFGANVSDADGFGGLLGISENNLMGTGRTLSSEVFWMQKYYGCKINIFDPYFTDRDFGVGLKIGLNRYNRKNIDHSVNKSAYLSPYVRYFINERLIHRISCTASTNERSWWDRKTEHLYDSVPEGNEILEKKPSMKEEYGKYNCNEISSTLLYHKTDNFYQPRNGYTLSMTNSYSGLGGGVRFFRNELEGRYYYPLTKKFTFITGANVGYIHEIKGTRSVHRYSLGGDGESMRGFDSYGIGPRYTEGDEDSIGGNKFWTLSFMVEAPLSTREVGINGVVFLDFGSAWGSKYPKSVVNAGESRTIIEDSSAIRSSIGVAIKWAKSPLGLPLSFVFGFPIKKKKFDRKQTFTLTGLM
ncbi:MAG: outer membrane protein assembly factor BamA [Holosporaceae bacterium]|jgi:outer membrane protein insertion porin family|nr:outer membrane protein assembly factor BamA [Holosporaceae bacterium]